VPRRIGEGKDLTFGIDELVHDLRRAVPLVLELAQHHAAYGGEKIRAPGHSAHVRVPGEHEDVQRRVVGRRLLDPHPVIDRVRIEVELRLFQPDESGQRRLGAADPRGDHRRVTGRVAHPFSCTCS
jgi:hypothetical protein